ncbi:MAG TPA: DUF5011 domain-containing protein [Candidatus Hydrogenedentes bacterium]|nr:DUF5011 domain-containing protein [Candidatus Hydrogenedentota bacterium]
MLFLMTPAHAYYLHLLDTEATISGGQLVARVYDPNDASWHTWNGGGPAGDVHSVNGIVAASVNSQLYVAAYDPGDRNWHTRNLGGPAGGITTASGVVAASVNNELCIAAYDPGDRNWHTRNGGGPAAGITTASGVVAASVNNELYAAAYDPGDRNWHTRNGGGPAGDIHCANGIVAASVNSQFYVAAYDPGNRNWHAWNGGGPVSNIAITGGTVSALVNGQPQSYFAARSPRAYFTMDRSEGNCPLYVQFSDNSVGGINSWWWDFGDTGGSSERSPSHTYTTAGRYAVRLIVSGPGGSHTATGVVLTDLVAPSGSVLINGGVASTNSVSVTLSLSATDNSGTVSKMRLSNDGATWNSWETFITGRSWTLLPGEGLKSVSVQFQDSVGNNSQSFSDTIYLDTTAPVITILGDNPTTVNTGTVYEDAGASALDNYDGDISGRVEALSTVNTSIPGDCTVTYDVSDIAGNPALQAVRVVHVIGDVEGENEGGSEEQVVCSFYLDGGQVAPPADSQATGAATFSVLPGGETVQLLIQHNVTEPTAASIKSGMPGQNGEVVIALGAGASPISHAFTMLEYDLLLAYPHYVEIQSLEYPNGEIRGQIQCDNEGELEGTGEGVSEGLIEGQIEGEGSPSEGELTEGEGEIEGQAETHTADQDGDHHISLSELLRIIQFYNSAGIHCEAGTEDGYAPYSGNTACSPHASDYTPQDWQISLTELLRAIQFYNSDIYYACPEEGTEDGFCPGA